MRARIELPPRRETWYWTVRHAQGILRRPREISALWRTVAERRRLAVTAPRRSARPRVLAYHSVGQPEMFVNNIHPTRFRQQLEQALALGYRFVPLDAALDAAPDDAVLALTFDDGFRSAAAFAPTLAELGIPWTMFVTTDWASGDHRRPGIFLSWEELGELAAAGVHLGSHSASHPDFGALGPAEAAADLRASSAAFADRLGFVPKDLAIPYGNAANWPRHAHDAALELGFERIWAQCESLRPAGTLGRSFVCGFDRPTEFEAMLDGAFDDWEEPAPV